MRTPQTHEAKARIIAFLVKIWASKDATVIRRNRGGSRMASAGRLGYEAVKCVRG